MGYGVGPLPPRGSLATPGHRGGDQPPPLGEGAPQPRALQAMQGHRGGIILTNPRAKVVGGDR